MKKEWAAIGVMGFLSGAAALVLEALWFHRAGLTFGNSVWASSLVTASFMAGLALGSAGAAAFAPRIRNAFRWYACLEIAIGVTGVAAVLILPRLTPMLVPVFRPLLEKPVLLNLVRLGASFLVLLVPATAMGATLPVLVASVRREDSGFGRVLGLLYGANTLGGVAGVLFGEIVLITRFGITGAALAAGVLNATAAGLAALVARGHTEAKAPPAPPSPVRSSLPVSLAAAAALSGALLLALEVVWFRFLLLYARGTSVMFATMLALVLLGIALGGASAAAWTKRDPAAHHFLPCLAMIAAGATILTYATFATLAWPLAHSWVWLACRLILPGSFLSGLVFPLLGDAVRQHTDHDTEAAGRLTFANTGGAMLGALLGGFVLLPMLGIEGALVTAAFGYAGLALLLLRGVRTDARVRYATAAAGGIFLLLLPFFPSGLARAHHAKNVATGQAELVAFEEGLAETVAYLRYDWGGSPHHYQLVTNGHSMSSTIFHGQLYMKLYVYWAMAMNPDARRALLICYGVGNTAKALTDTSGLTSIDVVDISREILELGRVPYPPPLQKPLDDPRVRVHVEDGRFFLATTDERFDLITAEPPPPKHAGVAALYSREYFTLLRERLNEGGVVTYWLPVGQLDLGDSRAITQAFCDAFEDCSLWTGGGGQWMLAGTRGSRGPGSAAAFARQWTDERVGPELRRLALETPETLGALFIADAAGLADWTAGTPPVSDDWPRRISPELRLSVDAVPAYRSFANPAASRARFERSAWVRRVWPAELRERSLALFRFREALEEAFYPQSPATNLEMLHTVLADSTFETLPLLLMGTDPPQVEIARRLAAQGVKDAAVEVVLGADTLAQRRYASAREHFDRALTLAPGLKPALVYRAMALKADDLK